MHWLYIHFGINGSGSWYGWWSGSGSDVGELAIIAAVIGTYRKWNCHVKGCLRLAHHTYEIQGVQYHLCRKHHPTVDHKNRKSADDFVAHAKAKRLHKPVPK